MLSRYNIKYRLKGRKYDKQEYDFVRLRATTLFSAKRKFLDHISDQGLEVSCLYVSLNNSDNVPGTTT